jgi:hypothetical protein
VRPFAAIAAYLRAEGLSAPDVLACDADAGLLVIEDFGDGLFRVEIDRGIDEVPLYEGAIDLLADLHARTVPGLRAVSRLDLALPDGSSQPVLTYDRCALEVEARLLPDWYVEAATAAPPAEDAAAAYEDAWGAVLETLPTDERCLTLRDYHAENLFWLPDRDGVARVGLIDFQDGLLGHPAYDLVSLLEDARRDVAPALAEAMLTRYCAARRAAAADFDEEVFRAAYAILGAQRNAKIVGIFARLWRRDGKPRYPALMPRVWRYLERDLSHPALAPVARALDALVPADLRGDAMAIRKSRGFG